MNAQERFFDSKSNSEDGSDNESERGRKLNRTQGNYLLPRTSLEDDELDDSDEDGMPRAREKPISAFLPMMNHHLTAQTNKTLIARTLRIFPSKTTRKSKSKSEDNPQLSSFIAQMDDLEETH